MKKGLKKVFAVGASAAVASLTLVGAFAYDLSDYPAPFVEDGVFNGGIVVGESAATSDVLGSIDIAASLQAAAKNVVSDGSSATATTVVEGGVLLEDANQDINGGDTIGTTLDDQDLDVLEDGVLEPDSGSSVDFEQLVTIADYGFNFVDPDKYGEPVLHLEVDTTDSLVYTVEFDEAVDFTELNNNEELTIFGKTFLVKNIDEGDDLELFAGEETLTISQGSSVEYDGHTIEIVGANSDGGDGSGSIHLSVDGETRTLEKFSDKTINGVNIYVQEIFISNIAGESAAAKIFIGSEAYDLGSGNGDDLELNDEKIEGVSVDYSANETSVDSISFIMEMNDIENEELGEDFDWLAVGDSFVDPVFDFELSFAEIIPAFENRDVLEFSVSGDDLDVEFTNFEGNVYNFAPYKVNSSGNISFGDDFVPVNDSGSANVTEGDFFIATKDETTLEPVSTLIELTNVYNDTTVKADFKDLTTGKVYTGVEETEEIGDTEIKVTDLNPNGEEYAILNNSGAHNTDGLTIFTKDLYKFSLADGNWTDGLNLTIEEDGKEVNFDEDEFLSGNLTFVASLNVDEDWEISELKGTSEVNSETDDANVDHGLTKYGTYFTSEADDKDWAKIYTLDEEMDMRVFFAPPTATITTMESAGAGYAVNPIALGLGLLDVDATLGAKPMIVVGGPSVNDIAAELMDNPTMDEIYETFQEGKSMIKWYDAEQAMLVAGFNAEDTRAASYVLAEYNDFAEEFSGSEMEVKTSEVSQVVVN